MDTTNKYFLPVSVVLAGLFIAGAVMWNGSRPVTPGPDGAASIDISDVNIEGEPFIGQPNAPLTLAFWRDFQCPFCKAFEVGGVPGLNIVPALPDIIKNYVDTGKAKVVFKDVVFLTPRAGPDSLTAALYSRSVWKLYPDKYFEWRTAMFTAQDEEGGGFGNADSIDKLNASIAGIDAAKVAVDVTANAELYTQAANANTAEAQKLGIGSTPSVVIGTQILVGALPFLPTQGVDGNFRDVIESELK